MAAADQAMAGRPTWPAAGAGSGTIAGEPRRDRPAGPHMHRQMVAGARRFAAMVDRLRSDSAAAGKAGSHRVPWDRLADDLCRRLFIEARAHADVGPRITPLALVAAGDYGRRALSGPSPLDLCILWPDQEHAAGIGERVAGLMLAGLADLGLEVDHAAGTVGDIMLLAACAPVMRRRLRGARLVSGQVELWRRLDGGLGRLADPPPRASARATR